MKIRYVTITLLLAVSLVITAAERSLQMKRQIAASALKYNSKRQVMPHGTLKELKATAGLTVMGYEEGGFVVISNDDRNAAVLAWSDNKFDPADMPDGLKWWLTAADEIMSGGMAYTAPADIDASLPAEVQPMLGTAWGQGAPYNLLCPNNYPSGCVATAMAQIMYYHKYPVHGEGTVWDSGSLTFVDFGSTVYAYEDMLGSYAEGYTQTSADAVATLMQHCGVSVGMKYAADGSGAYTYKVPAAMRDYFLYHKNISYRERDFHTNADWMSMVYKELAAGHPLLYAASDYNGTGAHAFVFDGYDEDGLVHVNWGWDGSANGYYDMSVLNPAIGSTRYQYSEGQNMITGAGMPDEDISHRSELVGADGFGASLSGSYLTIKLNGTTYYNLNDYVFSGNLHVMLENASASHRIYSISFADSDMNMNTLKGARFQDDITVQLPDGLADGTYDLYIGVQDAGFNEITPVSYPEGKTCRYVLTKNGTDMTITPHTDMLSGIGSVVYDNSQTQNETTVVYDLQGHVVYKSSSMSFRLDDVKAKGLLIIRNGRDVKKVLKQ